MLKDEKDKALLKSLAQNKELLEAISSHLLEYLGGPVLGSYIDSLPKEFSDTRLAKSVKVYMMAKKQLVHGLDSILQYDDTPKEKPKQHR